MTYQFCFSYRKLKERRRLAKLIMMYWLNYLKLLLLFKWRDHLIYMLLNLFFWEIKWFTGLNDLRDFHWFLFPYSLRKSPLFLNIYIPSECSFSFSIKLIAKFSIYFCFSFSYSSLQLICSWDNISSALLNIFVSNATEYFIFHSSIDFSLSK